MNTLEHLQRIKAKCKEMISALPPCESVAGWQSTIAAIDCLQELKERNLACSITDWRRREAAIKLIIASWPEELL